MALDIQGTPLYSDLTAMLPQSYMGVSNEWFVNRTPLFTRLPKPPAVAEKFNMIGHQFRARTVTSNSALSTDTAITAADTTNLMVGDILRNKTTGEYLEVTSMGATSVNVNRGVAGTTAAAVAANEVLQVVGNSRTGGEIDQDALTSTPTTKTQFVQTFQHVVKVSGLVNSIPTAVLSPGRATPFDQYKMDALQNCMDDIEVSSYLGKGEDPATATSHRGKQYGLRNLIATNLVTAPTNGTAYKPSDFTGDTITKCWSNGGNPDLMLVSTNFMTGLQRWSLPIHRLQVGTTRFGIDVVAFTVPFLGDFTIVPCPLLPNTTAIVLSSAEVRFRVLRPVTYQPYGRRGDAVQGDWIASVAIELENEQHHAWVEGITAFSPEA